ncbi:O-antigen ligase family protein [Peribacillus glennii]|uniref:O-antigen ligase-related domain-containing protein n=1 Tax=Peribacillus glennii TaxID=2303991 RepID=A0A372LEZ7_9BACI|nr:O-antigen ligase family protein [Peribacillus glennii]RFU64881.1 hypothetical protein D0466_02875 [Peribacillus glennii]
MAESTGKWLLIYLFFTMAVSSFVIIEPAPYDILMILFVAAGCLISCHLFPAETTLPILILLSFLLSNLLSLFFATDISISLRFIGITFYLAATWISLVGIGYRLQLPLLEIIFKGYLLAAFLAAGTGVLAYFQLLPNNDYFLLNDRAKSFFKDPNVYGPFLIIPALFSISMVENLQIKSGIKKSMFFLCFLLMVAGVIVSFSRAAWGNLAISLVIYMLVMKRDMVKKRLKTILLLILLGVPAFVYFINTPLVEELLTTRLSLQDYDNERFNAQEEAFKAGLTNPFGIGPGQSENVFPISTHSIYARLFAENGFLGLISFVILMILSLRQSYKCYWKAQNAYGVYYLVIFASLVGLVFNSFFVDTLHWRHFWVILALAWCPLGEKNA